MAKISLLSSFVFVRRVGVIFMDSVGNLSYNYASYVDFNTLRTCSPVCDVVNIKLGKPCSANDANYSRVDYVFTTVIFGRNMTTGTYVFRPVCSLSAIMLMIGSRIVMPAYHRQSTHKLRSWSLLRWLFTLLLYINMFALSFVALVALCKSCLCLQRVIMLSSDYITFSNAWKRKPDLSYV